MSRRLVVAVAVAAVAVLLAAPVPAQTAQDVSAPSLKIRIVFPPGISTDDVYLAYGLYTPGRIGRYVGLRGPDPRTRGFPVAASSGQGHVVTPGNAPPFYQIDGLVDGQKVERFQALVWAPGCRMAYFDVPSITANVEEHYTCAKLSKTTLAGRVRGVDLAGKTATIYVSYYGGLEGCFLLHTCDHGCVVSCSGISILNLSSAPIAPDGSFKVEVPDFSDDPATSHGELRFTQSVGEAQESIVFLEPQSNDPGPLVGAIKIMPSYPDDLILVPHKRLNH